MKRSKVAVSLLAVALLAAIALWTYRTSNRKSQPDGSVTLAVAPSGAPRQSSAQQNSGPSKTWQSPSAPLSAAGSPLETALGKGRFNDFQARLLAVGELGKDLSPADIESLYAYLLYPAEDASILPAQSFALRNDVLNVLREQTHPPARLTDVLLAIRNNELQPEVMRDYALQHMAPWYVKASPIDREKLLADLQAAAAERTRSYAGTALLALNRVQRENPSEQLSTLRTNILQIVEDSSANLLARISAVQLSGELRIVTARNAVGAIARDPAQPVALRVAAVGALGGLQGEQENSRILAELAGGKDRRLRSAAARALAKLSGAAPQSTSTPAIPTL